MAENEVYKQVAEELKNVDARIAEGEEYLAFLRDTGEPHAQQSSELNALKVKRQKYEAALRRRGF